jgi:hypothetical protein
MTLDTMLDQLAKKDEPELPKDIDALQLLQMEYRGEIVLTHQQRRAAEACLPFERPKLGVVATTTMNADDFASMLDRAIQRSGMKQIEATPTAPPSSPPPASPTPASRNLGPVPDRRFRRG